MSADGTWNITTTSPMGTQEGTLNLVTDGGTLTGKMSGPQGDIEIQDGTADGDKLTWKAEVTSPMAITLEVEAAVDGDEISGSIKLGAFGTASFSGKRG
ncbi:MAG: hypothetical protein E2O54_07545 [Gammaproteobacteria bacterium]|nr:MAG: hypothetical protein E2O58_02625 [Gammaproteobacteria bacterium]TDJ40546.1 MAG: hypothetical protein E2O54_07545 [Gammaproteobacteria bacterium]